MKLDPTEAGKAIEEEVLSLIRSGQVIENIDTVMRLETRIMERLKSGGATGSSAQRRSSSSSTNEWALLARYAAHLKQEEDIKKALEAHTRAEKAKEELRMQQEAAVARQKSERESKRFELQRVQQEVRVWRQAEVAKREARRSASKTLSRDRQLQMDQMHNRQEMARLLRQAADAYAANTDKETSRRAAEREITARAAARKELEAVFEGNRAAQRARAAARAAEQELDRKFMAQSIEKLARQEAERQAQLEKVRAVQAAQAADAATRPPFKIWVDEKVIERQAKEYEALAAEKEKQKIAAAAAAAQNTAAEVAEQLHFQQMARAAEAEAKAEELAAAAALEVVFAAEEAQKAKRTAEKNRKFKKALDDQVSAQKAARPRPGMTETEKKINFKLLKQAKETLKTRNTNINN
ncbi:hypothetical protein NADE_000110 [Nannochloris sp. 'desiccata']|nr:hypothetical protein KSW81_005097 [Chlorella desiccata (nom. nud.)]KAH7617907.1 hypothetical protein NADE_000110 [Chlorella desiccata (nom. nud.)]